jgi:hypothetical protein
LILLFLQSFKVLYIPNYKRNQELSGKNPVLIDGALLQWEEYFTKPYYDNDYKWLLEMLQKDGIFSNGINSAKKKKLSEPKKGR